MGYQIYADDVSHIRLTRNKQIINTINPHSYVMAKDDKDFSKALHDSDVLLPDGSGIVLAAKQINKEKIGKISGSDLHAYLIDLLDKKKGKVFYMGSTGTTLVKIKERLNCEHPNILAEFYSPPYKTVFSKEENKKILYAINHFKPDILFIGMTAPKQEKWVAAHKDRIDTSMICSIGAVFDFYAGTIKRPSQLWLDLHLEWLLRFLKEPIRLWKRNFISTPLFLKDLFFYKLGLKK